MLVRGVVRRRRPSSPLVQAIKVLLRAWLASNIEPPFGAEEAEHLQADGQRVPDGDLPDVPGLIRVRPRLGALAAHQVGQYAHGG